MPAQRVHSNKSCVAPSRGYAHSPTALTATPKAGTELGTHATPYTSPLPHRADGENSLNSHKPTGVVLLALTQTLFLLTTRPPCSPHLGPPCSHHRPLFTPHPLFTTPHHTPCSHCISQPPLCRWCAAPGPGPL